MPRWFSLIALCNTNKGRKTFRQKISSTRDKIRDKREPFATYLLSSCVLVSTWCTSAQNPCSLSMFNKRCDRRGIRQQRTVVTEAVASSLYLLLCWLSRLESILLRWLEPQTLANYRRERKPTFAVAKTPRNRKISQHLKRYVGTSL